MQCQSCGMPMKRADDYGSFADGSRNDDYCWHCFQDGRFMDEGITLEEKIDQNVEMAVLMGMTEEEARDMAERTLPGLKRWKRR